MSEANPATETGNPNAKNVTPANSESTVRIVSLPPITTTRDTPGFVVSMILALVGIFGIGVAIWTVRIIKRQTEATEDAAKAAADSVAAIQGQTAVLERQAKAIEEASRATIKIERAWIDVYLIKTGPAVYETEITNCGRTVAKIKEYVLIPKLSATTTVARYEFDKSRTVYCSKLLEPRDKPWITEELNLPKSLGKEDFAAVWGNSKDLAYYGVVRYEDIAGEPHETGFCYAFNALPDHRRLERINADEYNKHT